MNFNAIVQVSKEDFFGILTVGTRLNYTNNSATSYVCIVWVEMN